MDILIYLGNKTKSEVITSTTGEDYVTVTYDGKGISATIKEIHDALLKNGHPYKLLADDN